MCLLPVRSHSQFLADEDHLHVSTGVGRPQITDSPRQIRSGLLQS